MKKYLTEKERGGELNMCSVEIPPQYLEPLLLRCAETDLSLEELIETAIIHYMEEEVK